MTFTQSAAFETAAITAVRLGRQLTEEWPEVAVERTPALDPLLPSLLTRLANAEVFATGDDHALGLMLGAVCRTLDSYSAGYGDHLLREATGDRPFLDPEKEHTRRFGELMKAFIEARRCVMDTIAAERQIAGMARIEPGRGGGRQ